MEIKVGTDLINVSEFKNQINDKRFVERIFNSQELKNSNAQSLAGKFAVKEAFFKATQIRIKKWKEIMVVNNKGKPEIKFDPKLIKQKIVSLDISISHTEEVALAVVGILVD